jgi:hypothetical protein
MCGRKPSIAASMCPTDGSMRNSMGMFAGIVSRSVQRSSSKRSAASAPKLTCTTSVTGLRLLLVPAGAGNTRTR